MSSLKASLSRISKYFGSSPRRTSLEHVNSYPVTEESDYYQAGSFHPICLGDTFHHGQYTILRKLGYGQCSTVWLARDSKRQRYVALKTLRADCYGDYHDIFERGILSRIPEVSRRSSHQGRNYVSHLLEQFTHTGPNGDHVCLTFDWSVTQQLLLGLDFLHNECGIIHTDLKPTNILLELENPNNSISHYLSEVIPTPLVWETKNIHVRLIDFGVASWRERHLSDLIQSPALRAPEVTIRAPWDIGVMELVQGIVLFSGEASSNGTWSAEDGNLARIIEVLGQFPLEFTQKGNRAAYFFDKQGKPIDGNILNLLRIRNLKPTCLERLVDGQTKHFLKPVDMPQAEVPIFVDFIRGMLEIDPGSRKSAAELFQHEWIHL
ncbi:protein kinase [Aspergillus aurantiobrunneus]